MLGRSLILDFYVDEPACLGVPPYVSPYVRSIAGALEERGVEADYLTIDELRLNEFQVKPAIYDEIIIVAGCTVPGRYLGGKPGSAAEAMRFARQNSGYRNQIFIGGPIAHSPQATLERLRDERIHVVEGSIEAFATGADKLPLASGPLAALSYDEQQSLMVSGAALARRHFRFPFVIPEIETYRGCTRLARCSFCSEVFYGKPVFRPVEHVLDEIEALYQGGVRYFRLGRQADLFSYFADGGDAKGGFPRPNPVPIERLYRGIRERAPELKVLHMDNANPGTIAAFPDESRAIAQIISEWNTPYDTAAMGMESADPGVIEANNLKASPEMVKRAVEIVNLAGSPKGSLPGAPPKLTAGLNFIGGLPGETKDTHKMNFNFLKELLDEGFLLRRINIRKLNPIEGTRAAESAPRLKGSRENRFSFFKERVRREIDPIMMRRVFPAGTVLREVIPEKRVPGGFLGRQMGSYPIACHIWAGPALLEGEAAANANMGPFRPLSVVVIGHKERALIGCALEDDYSRWGEYEWKKVAPAPLAREIAAKGFADRLDQLPEKLSPLKKELQNRLALDGQA